MTGTLRITVVTACFNNADTIEKTIESVNAQTYRNVEHVFIDGGSTDATNELIYEKAREGYRLLSEQDYGIYDALNKGIFRSRGDVIGFLHADDFFANEGVLAQIALFFEDSDVQAVYGDLQYVRRSDIDKVVRNWRTKPFSFAQLKLGWMPPHPTFYVRKSWYEHIGCFDTRYHLSADYFSILQFFSDARFHAVYIPQVLVKMRLGGESNRSLKNVVQKSREDLSALRRSGVGGVGTLIAKNFRKIGQFLT